MTSFAARTAPGTVETFAIFKDIPAPQAGVGPDQESQVSFTQSSDDMFKVVRNFFFNDANGVRNLKVIEFFFAEEVNNLLTK